MPRTMKDSGTLMRIYSRTIIHKILLLGGELYTIRDYIHNTKERLGYLERGGEGERKKKNSTCVVTQIEVLS